MRIVRLAESPILREASCCKVEVVKGGEGKGGGGEGRERVAGDGLALGARDLEGRPRHDLGDGRLGADLVRQVELVEFPAVEMGQARLELVAGGGLEQRLDGPVLARL